MAERTEVPRRITEEKPDTIAGAGALNASNERTHVSDRARHGSEAAPPLNWTGT